MNPRRSTRITPSEVPDPIEPGGVWEEDESEVPRPGVLGSSWRGAMTAFRWVTSIVGLFAGLLILPGLALMELGLGSGRGIGIPRYVFNAFPICFGFILWSMILGAVMGLIRRVIGRFRRGRARPSWWASANRPIRLLG